MLLTEDDDVPALTAGCSVLNEALHHARSECGMCSLTGQARILLCQADCCKQGVDTCIYIASLVCRAATAIQPEDTDASLQLLAPSALYDCAHSRNTGFWIPIGAGN